MMNMVQVSNFLYPGDMAKDGYIQVSLDNRGTPSPKGRAWRKAIYQKIGQLNIRDQALGAKEVLKWNFIDTSRVAVWGWSGGGSSTLNLMFQYPDEYKTGYFHCAGNKLAATTIIFIQNVTWAFRRKIWRIIKKALLFPMQKI